MKSVREHELKKFANALDAVGKKGNMKNAAVTELVKNNLTKTLDSFRPP
jgi:hypothetical protein